MKYLKLFEDNKEREELEELIPELEDLYQNLKDHGYLVEIEICNTYIIQFPENISKIPYNNSTIDKYEKNLMSGISITISKYGRDFYINDIEDDLLFIESYTIGELDLKVNYYVCLDLSAFNNRPSNFAYYKNIENLPKDVKLKNIIILFIKA